MEGSQFSFGSEEISDTESSEDWDMDPVKERTGLATIYHLWSLMVPTKNCASAQQFL
jgi:hypothetical protein